MEIRKRLSQFSLRKLGKSLHLGTFYGIPVKVHWTFGLLILLVVYILFRYEILLWQRIAFFILVLTVFGCVILHEFGHALAGKQLGVKTRDIIISPIGGIARMVRIPDKPAEEFIIAIAGPMINLLISVIIGLLLYFITGKLSLNLSTYDMDSPIDYIRLLAPINFYLFLFNLIPAFPMDGGRILRAILSVKFGKVKATKIASVVGRVLAIVFIIFGVFGIFNQQLILAIIGLIIFMMAGQEYNQTRIQSLIRRTTVSDIMRTTFTRLHLNDPYSIVIEKYIKGEEKNFLVFNSQGDLTGTVSEVFIKDAIKNDIQDRTISQLMSEKYIFIPGEMFLNEAIAIIREQGFSVLAVGNSASINGMIDRNIIENFLRSRV